MKVAIIGGVAAGMSAASKIHRLDAGIQVTVYEKGGSLFGRRSLCQSCKNR